MRGKCELIQLKGTQATFESPALLGLIYNDTHTYIEVTNNGEKKNLVLLPVETALSAKVPTAVGVLVSTFAPALRAFPVALKAVAGTWLTVLMAPDPKLTNVPGV